MTPPRLLYGLDRLPTTMAADDPRLPAIDLGAVPLRLNSEPLPPAAWGDGGADHTARMAAVRSWLLAGCGDYNGALRRAVAQYLDAIAAHVEHHRDALAAGLAPDKLTFLTAPLAREDAVEVCRTIGERLEAAEVLRRSHAKGRSPVC